MKQMTTEEVAKAIADCYLKARNEANLSLLDTIYSPDVIVHDPSQPQEVVGLAALKRQYESTHAAVPNVRFSIDEMYLKGDKIVWTFTMSGTITGPFRTPLGELPPTGKSVHFSGVAIDRIAQGSIAEEWLYFNVLEILQPLGFTLAPPQRPEAGM
jgi:steroid delta-isomerase-like uncharacterized protein